MEVHIFAKRDNMQIVDLKRFGTSRSYFHSKQTI